MTIRTLVLSGGGGRGAFHAGVYKYLSEVDKAGVDVDHNGAWIPDVVVGTSIGAVNGAAIVQGVSAGDLEAFWLSLREKDVQGLPPGMGWMARRAVNMMMKSAIGVHLPKVAEAQAFSPAVSESWPPLPILPDWLSRRLIGRWNNLLDTAPLYQTLQQRLQLDERQLQNTEKHLLISATSVRTGKGVVFSNHEVIHPRTGKPHAHIKSPITVRRIIASCSIPLVYPWTKDDDGEIYWDGAVLANTPFGIAFDAVRDRPIEEPMEVLVVMMTPWWENESDSVPHKNLPQDFAEAMTWTLDWALLASFRADLKTMRTCNRIVQLAQEMERPPMYRAVNDVIIAPEEFLPVARIIDYDEPGSRDLISMGYQAAQKAFREHFPQPA